MAQGDVEYNIQGPDKGKLDSAAGGSFDSLDAPGKDRVFRSIFGGQPVTNMGIIPKVDGEPPAATAPPAAAPAPAPARTSLTQTRDAVVGPQGPQQPPAVAVFRQPSFWARQPEDQRRMLAAVDPQFSAGDLNDDAFARLMFRAKQKYGVAAPAPGPGKDLIGQGKEFLTQEPTDPEHGRGIIAGGPDLGKYVRKAGEFMLPGSWEQLATQTIMGLPGKGLLPAAGRVAGSGLASIGISAAKGEDMDKAAVNAGVEALTGEGVGAAARAGVRGLHALVPDTARIGQVFQSILPNGLRGKTPVETLAAVASGESRAGMQKVFDQGSERLFTKFGDPPVVVLPLGEFTGRSQGPASEMLRDLQNVRAKLYSSGAQPNPRDVIMLDYAEQDLMNQLRQGTGQTVGKKWFAHGNAWPQEAFDTLASLQYGYKRGMTLQRLFSGGTDDVANAGAKRVMEAGGKVNMPELQLNYQTQRGDVAKVLSSQELSALDQAMRYEPLKRDVPGSKGFGVHMSPAGIRPYLSTPSMPRRTGAAEPTAEAVSNIARRLGTRLGASIEEQ